MVNGAGNTFYDVRIPGLKLTVVHVDGVDVEPVTVDEFRFGPGETVDVIVQPRDDAYTIFAQAMDRTGYARARWPCVKVFKLPCLPSIRSNG
jgi:FtsP/CotA-like multicopper oxidase with cupredoxin domain